MPQLLAPPPEPAPSHLSLIAARQSTRLADVVTQLASILDVPRPRLLLMREEAELPIDATVQELGLCIADIIGGSCDHLTLA